MPAEEGIYGMNWTSWFESLAQDVRYGVRLLWTNAGFALVAILSLALGIGANTAIFQLLDAVRLRSLPVQNPHELAEVKIVGGNGGIGDNESYGELTRPMWEEIRRDHPPFSGVFAWGKQNVFVGEGSNLEQVKGTVVSGEFFRVLGVAPWQGRLITPEDEHACPESTAVVSHAYWQSKLGGREINSGTKLVVNGDIKQVIGVTPPSFFGIAVGERFDVVLPFCQPKELSRNLFDVTVIGRLRPGKSVQYASAQLAGLSPGIMAATEITGYDARTVKKYRSFRLRADPASAGVSYLRTVYDSSLWLLLAITGLVLLIACANLANLMLARASTREREIAIRLAVGAARGRLLRQLLIESSLLAAIGAALGIALAGFLSRVLVLSLSTEHDIVALPLGTDWNVLLFAAAVAALTCVVFGMAPAFRASGVDPVIAMKAGGRGLTRGRESFSLQRLLVVMQISVSLVLLVGALLFVRSFYNLMTLNPGMREEGVTFAFIGFEKAKVPQNGYEEFKRELLEETRSVPGIVSAAITTQTPLNGSSWELEITLGRAEGSSKVAWVSPGYFQTMGIPMLSGRDFNDTDRRTSQRVAIVNQAFARRFLNGSNPVGQTLRTHQEPGYPSSVYRIVGTIPDTKYDSLRGEMPPITFAPASQFPDQRAWTALTIYSKLAPAVAINSVKRRITRSHPEAIVQGRAFETQIRDGLVRERLMAMMSGFFGLVAALLATVGLYGVVSYMVTRRRNEIGIRIALGANRNQVVGLVMREAGLLVALGVAIGAVLSLAAGRAAGSLLFGLKSYDPLTLIVAIGLLAAIAAGASFVPARRTSKLDPMTALRAD